MHIISFLPSLPSLIAPAVHIDGPSNITAGQTVVLVCNTSQNLIVTWSREDGRPLPNTPDGNVLRIEMPGVEDGGVYRCMAEGVVATLNLVVVDGPPTASEKLTYDVLMTVLVVHACHCEHNIISLQVAIGFLFSIAQKVLGHVVFCSLRDVKHSDLMWIVKAMPVTVTSGHTSNACLPV